jgi:hypothetical protein
VASQLVAERATEFPRVRAQQVISSQAGGRSEVSKFAYLLLLLAAPEQGIASGARNGCQRKLLSLTRANSDARSEPVASPAADITRT